MMKLFRLFFVLFLVNACSSSVDNKLSQEIELPYEQLPWLADIRNQLIESKTPGKIVQYSYNNELVYWVDSCADCADNLIHVFNTNGEVICLFGGIMGMNTCVDFETKAKNPKILFDSTI